MRFIYPFKEKKKNEKKTHSSNIKKKLTYKELKKIWIIFKVKTELR